MEQNYGNMENMFGKEIHEDYLRSIIFGFQDALVSTTGAIAGVSTGASDKSVVVLAGLVVITVEALSMGAGQYMSEKSVHQMDKNGKHTDNLIAGGVLMTLSYFLGGLIPLTPILFLPFSISTYISVTAALIGLLVLGFIKAKLVKVNPWKSAIEVFIFGGVATLIGIIVGVILKIS